MQIQGVIDISRRKKYIKGKIYITNDSVFSRDHYSKSGRRVVAINNDKEKMHVVKIKGLYDGNGVLRKNLIPIEKYSVLNKKSGIDPFVHKKTKYNKSIREDKMIKTNVRLNKWDMKKISHLK